MPGALTTLVNKVLTKVVAANARTVVKAAPARPSGGPQTPKPPPPRKPLPAPERPPTPPPPARTAVPHPDLGINNPYRVGQNSWVDGNGVTHTPVSNLVGYKGVNHDRSDFYLDQGAKKQDGASNGNDDPNWKGFYLAEHREHAEEWAQGTKVGPDGIERPNGGVVLQYEHGRPTEVVTPPHELKPGADGLTDAQRLFGHGTDGRPFMDRLGDDGHVLRNPLDTGDGHELVVPWDQAGAGQVTRHGEVVVNRSTGWMPTYEGKD